MSVGVNLYSTYKLRVHLRALPFIPCGDAIQHKKVFSLPSPPFPFRIEHEPLAPDFYDLRLYQGGKGERGVISMQA